MYTGTCSMRSNLITSYLHRHPPPDALDSRARLIPAEAGEPGIGCAQLHHKLPSMVERRLSPCSRHAELGYVLLRFVSE